MILDWQKFIEQERPRWQRLAEILDGLSADPWRRLSVPESRELDILYQRAAADLARLSSMATDPATRSDLERLVARAYMEVHGGQGERKRWRPWAWISGELPRTFRRHLGVFQFTCLLMLAGALFGGLAISFDPRAKEVLMPFRHLSQSPSERVAKEEQASKDRLAGHKATFSGQLMVHNTQVTLTAMALGIAWGVGTIVVIFYNGITLGAVMLDYIRDGQTVFMLGWLLPHGVIEIPAMLIGGQSGLVLARAVIGRGQRLDLAGRMRAVSSDVVSLCVLAGLMLVWAGVIESFLSQYHEPVIPYWLKILVGCIEAVCLVWFLSRAGRAGFRKDRR